jgi:hypothetical protein
MDVTVPTAPRKGVVQRSGSFSDEEKEAARNQMPKAFAILGLHGQNGPVCPSCGQDKKGKVKLHDDGWKCFTDQRHEPRASGSLYCDSIDLLRDAGYSFRDAINVLLDRPVGDTSLAKRAHSAPDPSTLRTPEFRAVVDSEVYASVMLSPHVSLEAAQSFYGTWHISEKAVEEAGARYITDADALHAQLTEQFGIERLVLAGIIAPKDPDKPTEGGYFLLNKNYPVIEPHVSPLGVVVGMQFRASHLVAKRIKAYPSAKDSYETALAAWVESGKDAARFPQKAPRYEPKFLSLRGAGPDSWVGCGLYRIGRLSSPTQIYVVEGFKDLLATRTMGREAYAIPGVSGQPPQRVMEYLKKKKHVLRICMDADDAGRSGAQTMLALAKAHEIPVDIKEGIPEGMDVTDVLVQRRANAGCACTTCIAWRDSHTVE